MYHFDQLHSHLDDSHFYRHYIYGGSDVGGIISTVST